MEFGGCTGHIRESSLSGHCAKGLAPVGQTHPRSLGSPGHIIELIYSVWNRNANTYCLLWTLLFMEMNGILFDENCHTI